MKQKGRYENRPLGILLQIVAELLCRFFDQFWASIITAASVFVTINKLNHSHSRGITITIASLDNPRIAATALSIARAKRLKQLCCHGVIPKTGKSLSACMKIPTLT